VLVPCLVLGLAEAILRLSGHGYPTSFFLRQQIQGRSMLVENSRFGLRFFPYASARSPAPVVMSEHKLPGTYRIFLLGESAALGDPRPAYGMGRYLEVLLQERFPGTRFEVVGVAMTAINSHAIRLIADECARYEGDLWLVYMGNNEMVGPFGAATVFGPQAPGLGFIRTVLALKATRVGQLLDSIHQGLSSRKLKNNVWLGMRMFQNNAVGPDDPRRQVVIRHFEKNLEAIMRAGHRAGCPIILSTVASNLKDCAPFASGHRSGLTPEAIQEWDRSYHSGQAKETAGDWTGAIADYGRAAALDPAYAELQFRLGHCYRQTTNEGAARAAFEKARDNDTLPFRADSAINNAIQRVSVRQAPQGVYGFDAGRVLSRYASEAIPGRESFFEHVHLNLDGNYRLARALAEAVTPRLPAARQRENKPEWASEAACQRYLGLTDWNRCAIYESVLDRTAVAPFTHQLTQNSQRQQLEAELAELKLRRRTSAAGEAADLYREALSRSPADYRLHENFAEFLEATGDIKGALTEWKSVRDLLPHHFVGYFQAGRLLARTGQTGEATDSLNTALRLEPRSAETRVELGKLLAKQGKGDEAIARFTEALHWQPGDPRIHLELADALARAGRRPAAMDELRRAILIRPTFWEARYLLGVELALIDSLPEAQREFEEVVRLRPDHVLAHLNLGVALIRQGQVEAAKREFNTVLRLEPQNQKALQYLQTLDSLVRQRQKPDQPR